MKCRRVAHCPRTHSALDSLIGRSITHAVPVLGVECVITAMDSAIRRSHNFSDRALVSCQQSFSQENRLPCSLSAIATGVEDRHWAIELEAA